MLDIMLQPAQTCYHKGHITSVTHPPMTARTDANALGPSCVRRMCAPHERLKCLNSCSTGAFNRHTRGSQPPSDQIGLPVASASTTPCVTQFLRISNSSCYKRSSFYINPGLVFASLGFGATLLHATQMQNRALDCCHSGVSCCRLARGDPVNGTT